MSFFDYKGTDFMKMRSINKKSKLSYMQELLKRFNADRKLQSLKEGFLAQSKEGCEAFLRASVTLPHAIPVRRMPGDVTHSIPLDTDTRTTLNALLEQTPEFPYHESLDDFFELNPE